MGKRSRSIGGDGTDPEPKKAKSPEPKKAKSPEPKKAKSPEPKKAKSPEPKKAKSPEPKKAKSPEPKKAKSPEPKKAKSPEPKKAKSPEPKKAKSPEVEFTGTLFKSLVKDPNTALKGLQQFITLSRKLPSPHIYDVVEGYIKISVECSEMLKLLDGERRPESETMLFFQALEAILLRTASDLSHLSVAGVNIVKYILNTHMKLIYSAVYSETHRMSRICLNLLSAMVTQGPDCARDVFSHFDFNNKYLPGLLKKRDKQGRPDVRMAYIQFALSFLISGDNTNIVQVLELKGFFSEIFFTGIKEDRISTINLLLSLLQTKVIQNKAITKTQKVRFFTSAILNHIASLYRWNGIADVRKDVQDTNDPKEAGKLMMRELVHNFLKDLCCSLKHGINFYDPSLGTAARAGNLVLLQFLVGLKSATEDELIGELVVDILKVCPDLLSRYFKETQYSFVPRLKTAWLDNIKLLKKIYDAQPSVSVAFKTTEYVPLPRLINMVMITTVAPVCNKTMLTQGLNVPNKIVKHTILSLISSILKRAEQNINHCLKEEVWQKSDLYTPTTMADFAQKYREALSKLLPDINTVVATWQSLLKHEEAGKEEVGKTPEKKPLDSSGDLPVLTEKEDDVQTTLVKTSLLRVLCLYQRVVPHVVSQSNFDFSKLLKGIVSERGLREEVPPVLQHQILQVALELPANKFTWFKVQDTPDVGGGEKSVFYLLLKMFASCHKTQLKTSTGLLIIKILRDSGVFEYTWQELELWLRCLDKVEENSKELVIQFLEQALVKLVSNPYPYTDKAADYVQEASVLQSSLGKQDSDTVSIPISHIDDVMDMVDVIVEGSEGLDEEVGFNLDEEMILQTFPFSAVVPVVMEARNRILTSEEEEHECVIPYLVSVLTDILHTQRDPLALCLMLQSYDKELKLSDTVGYIQLHNFYNYYSLWLPPSARESTFSKEETTAMEIPEQDGGSSFNLLLKKTFVDGYTDDDSRQMLKDSISQTPQEELPMAVKHTLLCIKTTVDDFNKYKKSTGSGLIGLYLDLLGHLLCQYQQVEDSQNEKTEEVNEEFELFLEANNTLESPGNTVLDVMLSAVFKHPILESWFLALQRQSVPPHSLNPVSVKLLSSAMNQGLIQLLKSSAPFLQKSGNLHLLAKYFEAISISVLKELEVCKKSPSKLSSQLEALQSLHLYMDTAQLNELIIAIFKLPEEFLLVDSEEESIHQQLSGYGKVLVELLSDGHQRKQCQEDLAFWVEQVRGIGRLLSSSAGTDLEPLVSDALQREPAFAHVVEVDVLTHCLDKRTPRSLGVAAQLVQCSRTHQLQFELWCLKPGIEKLLRKNVKTFVPIVNIYMKTREEFQCTQLSKVSTAVLHILKEAFWKKLVKVALSTETSEQTSDEIALLSKLVQQCDTEDLTELISELPATLVKTCSIEKWALADCVQQAADRAGAMDCSWQRALLAACMKCLTDTYGTNKDREEVEQEAETAMLSRLHNLMPLVKEDVPTEWNSLVKAGLKYRYKDCPFLDALCAGIEEWYEPSGPCTQGLVQLPVIHMMVMQHSLFLPNFLRSREEESSSSTLREKLADLLGTITRKCPSVCDKNHFAVFLGAYGATLSITDQKILSLLQTYEQNNLSLRDFRLLLWGPAAVEHHKTRKSLGKSLWQQPTMEEILGLLDREKMLETILNFPLHRKLIAEAGKNKLYEDRAIDDFGKLYDPCFLLPLFSELLRPDLVVDCVKFVEVNALGLTLAALSSYDYSMRAAANYVLGSLLTHLEGGRFRDKKQLQYLMDVIKNGIRQENLRLTYLLALYGARAAQLIFRPEEHMYIKINRFLLSHEYLDLKKVPDFYRLFYSFDIEHKVEREWILGVLCDGMRDKHCYELYDYQRIFMVIMAFYNSPLSDETSQTQILEILTKASKVQKAAYELTRDHSLLSWIQNILEKRYVENKTLGSLITLVTNLWITNLGNKEKAKSKEGKKPVGLAVHEKLLPIHLVNEIFGVSLVLLKHIRTNLDGLHLCQYFCTLSSILQYRSRVLEAFKEMGRFAVNEQVFSDKNALLLLHKWSSIEKDLDLQERIGSLAKEFKVKELISTIKEKFRQPVPRHLRKRIETAQHEILEPHHTSHLEESRNHVKSILMHWKPNLPNLPSNPTQETGEDPDQAKGAPTEEEEPEKRTNGGALVCTTACLVAKWIIKVEGEAVLNARDLKRSLHWLKSCIVPRSWVVQELLKDGVWRSTLYKLYYKIFSDQDSGLELLGIANQVMMNLIEAQNMSGDTYQAVKDLCLLSGDHTNDSQKAAASFLASLYIGDMWLGAKSPVMFITYVKMVCEGDDMDGSSPKEKTPRKKKKKDQEAMVSLCRDLSAAVPKS
ncbi:nucleolar pre-ribosomal-associated protein 1 isoform X2 [Rana temporaria]|uniref:nucleolar pre-ribosomal-associated protein 1 isoform X2 n=1 Tax=Rana temporaria TaxID=8407 RepID=UPI001AAD3CF0|nr:nucleolar pre-ribosomal-associated protein 1 isoform X2 [Rana temporaria]